MRKKRKVSQNYLDTILIPNPVLSWKEEEGIIVIALEHKGFYDKLAQKFFHKPKVSYIRMDAYGSVLWKALDGNNSVYDVIQCMIKAFPEEESRMIDRVVTFLYTLQRQRFVIPLGED